MTQVQSAAAVHVNDLWFRHPSAEVPALKGISLTVETGECIGIIGPSGAGKSTLCQAIRGIVPHSTSGEVEGSVRIFGEDITASDATVQSMAKVALVLQDPEAQIVGMTVLEDLAFGPENYGIPRPEIIRRAGAALERVGLTGLLDRDTFELSGGQKQRLAIASALCLEPSILVLDEPTSELDPLGKDQVFKIIQELRSQDDTTIVVVEHEVDRLVDVVDRIIVMHDGQVTSEGTPLEVFSGGDIFERTFGERIPAAAHLVALLNSFEHADSYRPTLDIDDAVGQVQARLQGVDA